jgi:hypothetical protein
MDHSALTVGAEVAVTLGTAVGAAVDDVGVALGVPTSTVEVAAGTVGVEVDTDGVAEALPRAAAPAVAVRAGAKVAAVVGVEPSTTLVSLGVSATVACSALVGIDV